MDRQAAAVEVVRLVAQEVKSWEYMSAATKLKVLSVLERITDSADIRSPSVFSSSSSSAIRFCSS